MGGVAGHLAHLYDNRNLTYNEMSDILRKAASGELVGTEKTDGYNIYLGYVDGKPRAARNKGDMARGGMTLTDLVRREFKGGDKVKKAYLDAFKSYKAALQSLTDDELSNIFGEEGDIFYNTEIQGPSAPNVVNYDENVINIHHMGHKRYNKEDNTLEIANTEIESKFLDSVMDRFEGAAAKLPFDVRRTAFLTLNKITNDAFLDEILHQIRQTGYSGDMTINDYLRVKIKPLLVSSVVDLPEITYDLLMNRILGIPNSRGKVPSLNQITKGMSKELKTLISSFVKDSKHLIGEAIWPIELAIHDLAVELLRGLKSAYILNTGNEKEVARLKAETETAIKNIQNYKGPEQEEAHAILAKQLKKLKHHDNIDTVVEGFVFQIGDQMYKFTGNYAPMNQLLGLFKYGRGKIKPISLNEAEGEDKTKTALFPGGFKPPHRGHMSLVKHYLDQVGPDGKVIIFMGSGGTTPRTIHGNPVTYDQALKIWEIYLANEGITLPSPNVEIRNVEGGPIGRVVDYVTEANPDEEIIYLGAGEKDGERWKFMLNNPKYNPNEVEVHVGIAPNYVDGLGHPMSATSFRKAIENDDKELINSYIPRNSEADYDEIVTTLKGTLEESQPFLGIFHRLIEEALEEITKEVGSQASVSFAGYHDTEDDDRETRATQSLVVGESELEEISAMGAAPVGAVEGDSSSVDKKRKKKKIDEIVNGFCDYLLEAHNN